ncbi:hypothetical protein E2C01_008286 [Portunus trituberculatus]|uniref:Uncharacterized protein n=1 Tax=Portunus trituberculatus TaxID=210409 RepID=A0A5B7D3J8_PORTR|nr:hypothetical protein [Portunus trituberculatus]
MEVKTRWSKEKENRVSGAFFATTSFKPKRAELCRVVTATYVLDKSNPTSYAQRRCARRGCYVTACSSVPIEPRNTKSYTNLKEKTTKANNRLISEVKRAPT